MTPWPAHKLWDLLLPGSTPVALKNPVLILRLVKFILLTFHHSVTTYSALAGTHVSSRSLARQEHWSWSRFHQNSTLKRLPAWLRHRTPCHGVARVLWPPRHMQARQPGHIVQATQVWICGGQGRLGSLASRGLLQSTPLCCATVWSSMSLLVTLLSSHNLHTRLDHWAVQDITSCYFTLTRKNSPYGRLLSRELQPSAANSGALRAHFFRYVFKIFWEHFFLNFFPDRFFSAGFSKGI